MHLRGTRPFTLAVVCLALLTTAASHEARAQPGVLRGVVYDSSGAPLADVDIGIVSVHRLARTDAKGRFSIDHLPSGAVEVTARRLGYTPQTLNLTVNEGLEYSYTITLVAQATTIDGMDVTEKRQRAGVEEFYQRRTRGIGVFFTRDDLLARHARIPSDILQSTPGVRFVRAGTGKGIRFTSPSNGRRECIPSLWIDGQLAQGAELDDVSVNDVEGIEVYQSMSTTPAQFWRGNGTPCGTIVVWSKTPGH
ncbi:MAG: TonB-dependent receptor [Gemmatimonadaceae bacterium]